jgi:hypothetical protein
MMVNKYCDFVIGIDNVRSDESGTKQFSVRVWESPAGESRVGEYVSIPPSLSTKLRQLENRNSDTRDIISLGEQIGDILLPEQARKLFINTLNGLQSEAGLRLRLKLDPSLASIPWEYLYIQDLTDKKDITGFCALNPQISIVRHEPLPIAAKLNATTKARRLLVALASPEDEETLNITKERANIENALKDIPGIKYEFVPNATAKLLNDQLISGADIFHFAGHGKFKQSVFDTTGGYIILLDENGKSAPMPTEQLAINLRDRGVQLVVLGACETGRRDEKNVWSGVVTGLMAAGIPAAVAMQYKIWDESAIAFSRSFYKALAAGLPLDRTVSLGRIAVFNHCESVKDQQQRQKYWRDWGVPVLYCRTKENFVLPAIKDENQRQALVDELEAEKNFAFVQKNTQGVNFSGTANHSPIIVGSDNVVQKDGKYNVYIRSATGPVSAGDNSRAASTHIHGSAYNSTVTTAGGDVTVTPQSSGIDIRTLFESVLDRVRKRPADPHVDITDIISYIDNIRNEIASGQKANLTKLGRWLKHLAEIAPDIHEPIIAILERPDIDKEVRLLAADIRKVN